MARPGLIGHAVRMRPTTRRILTTTISVALLRPPAGPDGTPRPLTLADLRDHVADRLDELPSFRWRVLEVPGRIHHPVAYRDPDFDLDFHLRELTLPEPGSADDLVTAIDAYASAIREGGDLLWLGINAHALAHRARRDGVEIPELDIPDERSVLNDAMARSVDNDWAAAVTVEASLLVGEPFPVETIVERLAGASPFVHASLRRQLIEVWGLPDDHPAIVTLSEFLLRVGSNAPIELPRDPGGFEKLFGSEWPIPIDTYRQGLAAAESVAHILLRGQVPIGTGFLVDGAALHPDLAGHTTLITNEHVVPSPERADGAPADALTVRFDAHDTAPIDDLRAVFWSDRDDLDVCVLVSDTLDAAGLPTLTPSDRLPAVMPGAHVYVVGHPGGRSLCLSIRGNDLVDQDGVRIHYRAPTEKGSSGSPVFDEAWQLVGTHHYGSPRLPRLHGKTGTYGGNEGTSFVALRHQLAERGLVL